MKCDASDSSGEALAWHGLDATEVVERTAELLEVCYRSADLGNLDDVLSEAIYIMLSLQTREGVYRRVFRDLRDTFPTWNDILDSSQGDLEDVLRPAGLHRQRADRIRQLLARVADDNACRGVGPTVGEDITLEYIKHLDDLEAERYLLDLPGVGPKSARCILAYSLRRDSFAVDTHAERILRRLGVVPERHSPNSKVDHDDFAHVVAPRIRRQLHINLVHHGRAVCRSSRPRCSECVLVSFCARGRQQEPAPNDIDDERPTAVDLFAGAGGLGWGFRREGYNIGLAIERDRHAAQSYRANNPGVPVLEADVTAVTGPWIRRTVPRVREVHVVLAGPPCQGYSAAGSRKPDNTQNKMFLA